MASCERDDQKGPQGSNPAYLCALCGISVNLLLCARCRNVFYCSKDHQKLNWKNHKQRCIPSTQSVHEETRGVQQLGESVNTHCDINSLDLNQQTSDLKTNVKFTLWSEKQGNPENQPSLEEACILKPAVHSAGSEENQTDMDDMSLDKSQVFFAQRFGTSDPLQIRGKCKAAMSEPYQSMQQNETKIADYVVKCLNGYGICVVDNFLGEFEGTKILEEVLKLEDSGAMKDGQILSSQEHKGKIRGDKITWVEKGDQNSPHISAFIHRLDSLLLTCNGRLGQCDINGRTRAMVACYPGAGTKYMKHIDNPNKDGRCVTSIYYINKDWDISRDGGLLRIFPTMWCNKVADIEPKFDRLLFFWSDRRNPHEVHPAYRTRFAITVWFFDKEERESAKQRYQYDKVAITTKEIQKEKSVPTTSSESGEGPVMGAQAPMPHNKSRP